jgi:undecaprenyl-diphosphatase
MDRQKTNLPLLLGSIHELDVVAFQWLMKRKHLLLWARLCRLLSRTADGFGYPLLGLALWFWGGEQGSLFALTLALAFALERPLYLVLKKGLKRNRPANALPDYQSFIIPSDQFSFPSGHTSGAFVVATALLLFYPQFAAPAFAWGAMVGVSRVTLGVHFPTDTLAGATMGTALTLIAGFWLLQ